MANVEKHEVQYDELDDAELDQLVNNTLRETQTPGMSILVVHGNKTFAKAYGLADIENNVKITPKTLFQTGSTTKSFTSAMAAHLVESPDFPSIAWDTPIADLIADDFVLDQSTPEGVWATKRVTIEDALSHRAGMSRHDLIWINGDPTTQAIVRSLRHVPVHRELRQKFEYCNTMYTAVSHAVETLLQKPFKTLLKEHIFEPLGMHSTVYTIPEAVELVDSHDDINHAKGYMWNHGTEKYEPFALTDIAPSKGSGGIVSNVLDYTHWVRHLMNPTDINYALSKNAVKEMRTPRMLVDPDQRKPYVGPQAYGLGLYSQVYSGREIIQHSGASPGHMSTMIMVPPTAKEDADSGLAIVIMQNTWSLAQDIVAWHLLDKFLGTPPEKRFDMAEAARKAKSTKAESMKSETIVNRLFDSLDLDRSVPPTLPIESYLGVYRHVAYHEFKISRLAFSDLVSKGILPTSNSDPSETNAEKESFMLLLEPAGLQKSYFRFSAPLHHVSGQCWWAHRILGPSCWLTDEALKLFFIIGDDGAVQGMKFQAEPMMPETLAFFEKVG